MKMRHNELVQNDNGEIVFRSQTQVGRYSQWFDHSDIHFFEVFKKLEFEFKPHKIHFLVPLFNKDLYLIRSENTEGILSEQFIYCSHLKNLQTVAFRKWLFGFILNTGFRSVTLWSVLILNLMKTEVQTFTGLFVPLVVFLVLSRTNRFYLIQKIMTTELIIWMVLLSSFYCLNS